jgi:integrase
MFKSINAAFLRGFYTYLTEVVSASSAAAYYFKIMSILRHAVNDGLIAAVPRVQIKTQPRANTIKYLDLKEIRQLSATPCKNPNVRNAFLFSCFSGLRYSDLAALRWDNIKENRLSIIQEKTNESLTVDLSKEAINILLLQRGVTKTERTKDSHPEGTVFFLPRRSTTDKALKAWARSAGLGRSISMHVARHSFGTLATSSEIDILTVSKLMGHTGLETTMIYAKITDSTRKKAVDKLPTLDSE